MLGIDKTTEEETMKTLFTTTALVLAAIPLVAAAEPANVSSFPLAQRIAEKIAAGEDLSIYVSYQDVANEFAPQIRAGVERADALDGVTAAFIGPVGSDADAQINEIESLLETMDGLAISSVSTDALAPLIQRVLEAGIPVVTYNTDNPESDRLAFAGQDLVQSGREAGKLMCDILGEGRIMILTGDAAAQWSLDREQGAREALAACPGIEVVQTVNTTFDPQEMYANIENAMLGNPDVTGLLSLECCTTPAAGSWVERNGRIGEVKIVGFDLVDQTVELVRSGAIQATIDQAPEAQGFAAVDLLVRFLNGEDIDDVDTGVGIYTAENIGELQ
jgi:simple sugar transport system substrate-binding protein